MSDLKHPLIEQAYDSAEDCYAQANATIDFLDQAMYTRQLNFDPGTPTNIDPPRELIPFQEAKNTCFFLLNFWRISFFSTLGKPCQGESEATLIRFPKCARLNSAMSSRMPSGSSQIGEMGQF